MKQRFSKTGALLRFILRRDRMRISIWIGSFALVSFVVAQAFEDLYATDSERQAIAETMLNPAMTAMVGQGYGLDNYTTGAMMAHQMLLFTALTVGLMSILLVTRHTRSDEEVGRLELIRSLPVGRLATLHATMLSIIGTNFLLAIITGFGLYVMGIESINLHGSLLYGSALGVTGIFFGAVTAVFAQTSENARSTIGLSITVLLLAYVVRGIGDVGNEALSWLSPLGWILRSEVYVNNYWWPIILTLIVSVLLMVFAYYLNSIRDLEASFFHAKPGKKQASTLLTKPFGLSFRLQRTGLIAWAVGLYLLGVSYGSVLGDLESFLENMSIMEKILTPTEGFTLTEQFLTMLMSIMAILSTIPALMAILKLIGEERHNRTEHILTRAVSRTNLLMSHFVLAIISSFVMLFVSLFGLWSAGTTVMDEAISFSTFFNSAMIYLPAIWVMIGFAILLIGFLPRFTGLIWLYLVFSFFIVYLGELLQLPNWLSMLSPYGHIPNLPVDDMNVTILIVLISITIFLTIIGTVGYRNRDIQG